MENGATESDKRKGLVTWIFDDGFVPTAKLTKDGNYSIISDYMGTPVEAYDSTGKKVWEQELDIYGKVIRHTGDADLIPLRYQGQYDDIETGLYYNRFRYYDPDMGQYTQPDPIGLEGGNPTLYSYVSNPNWWVDPLGLERGVGNNSLSNDAIVVRGGTNRAEQFTNGSGVTTRHDGRLNGVSVNSTNGASVTQLSEGIPHGRVGVTTVGDVRALGGNVVPSPTAGNPSHATLSGISATQAERLFNPTIRNPLRPGT